MPQTHSLLFAKKFSLPSWRANTLQSLNMAVAYHQAGAETWFYPGLRARLRKDEGLADTLAAYGIDPVDTPRWTPLPGGHKGLYGALHRLYVGMRYIRGVDAVLARDIGDALYVSHLRQCLPHLSLQSKGQPARRRPDGKKRAFLFEMHEVLYSMHRRAPGRHSWQKTLAREKCIMSQADALVLMNAALEGPAREELGFKGPVIVEGNGFNPDLFHPLPLFEPAAPWPGPEDTVTLLYIGATHQGKGVQELILAMNDLPQRFHLRVIGGSKEALGDMERLRAAVPGGNKRIELTGRVHQKDLYAACAGAHIAVIPQQPGGDFFSPIKLYEYMALGLPIVCTPLTLFQDYADLLHKALDATPQGLAAAAKELAANQPLAEVLRRRSVERAKEHTWKARAGRVLDFAWSL